ncbi:flagella basal body P-ring formation protein FlgA [Sphingomonas sp.]|uniref:flagella basal body P-ring formation protein FlgA n=1 Tax=Sphingomonas sp. TaxID=28214 RepID=UPI001D89C1DD|nr:flagella basal body P-ring formation protein FlgA [Sphingomonas sp.]MBX9795368.1 flagella basal body P-ring formation protein FlgA [Sphingomonas sp.]
MRALAATLLIALPAPALAQAYQDTAMIDRAVANFTGHPIGSEGGARAPVDARLRLAPCPMATVAWRAANHDSVVISCPAPEWRIYVPVLMPATAQSAPAAAAAPVPAPAARPAYVIRRGDPVTVSVNANGFSITRDGVAMGDAPVGGRFLVDVDGNRKGIQAVALDAGRATLPGYGE